MAQFGQTLPATPRVYVKTTTQTFSRAEFIKYLCRILKAVGMVPIFEGWAYNALEDGEEQTWQVTSSGLGNNLFPFDFPDPATFAVGANTWRPFININAFGYGTPDARGWFGVESGIRPPGRFDWDTQHSPWSATFTGARIIQQAWGWGDGSGSPHRNAAFSSATYLGNVWANCHGKVIQFRDWKSSTTDPRTALMTVRNVLAYLGPAGLFVFVGSDTTDATFGDIFSMGFIFGAGRVPGRALPVLQDINLPRINPIVSVPMLDGGTVGIDLGGTDGSNFSSTVTNIWNGTRLRVYLTGIHFSDSVINRNTIEPVFDAIYNLENVEQPFSAETRPFTLNSPRPRTTSAGAGTAHILGRSLATPGDRIFAVGESYGPAVPQWSDIFDATRFRLVDQTVPLGVSEEPETLDNWRIVPYHAAGMRVATYAENEVALTDANLPPGTKTAAAGARAFAALTPNGVIPATPATPLVIASSNTAGVNLRLSTHNTLTPEWNIVGGNAIRRVFTGALADDLRLQFVVDKPSADLETWLYDFRASVTLTAGVTLYIWTFAMGTQRLQWSPLVGPVTGSDFRRTMTLCQFPVTAFNPPSNKDRIVMELVAQTTGAGQVDIGSIEVLPLIYV